MITYNWIVSGEIFELVIEGACNADEVVDIIKARYGSISKGVLWNISEGTISNLTAHDLRRIALTVKDHAVHARTAFYGSEDLEYGMFRMYESYAEIEDVSHPTKVFRDRDEAIKWLMEGDGSTYSRKA